MKNSNQHIPSLDCLRGLAALAVVIGHARMIFLPPFRFHESSWQDWVPQVILANHGSAAVLVFFLISGFLVGGAAIRELKKGPQADWARFFLRRFVRLAVVLWPALALTIACDALSHVLLRDPQAELTVADHSGKSFTALELLGNAFLMQGILVDTLGSNSALWTLSYEWSAYLAFPALLVAFWGSGTATRLVAGAFAFGVAYAISPSWRPLFFAWCVGAAVSHVRENKIQPPLAFTAATWALAFAVVMDRPLARTFLGPTQFIILPLVSAFFIWSAPARLDGRGGKLCGQLGAVSYSLYATHMPLLFLLRAALSPNGFQPSLTGWMMVIISSCACVIFAFAIWWCFEARTHHVYSYLSALWPRHDQASSKSP